MKKKKFNAATETRRRARKAVGTVPVTKVIPNKRKKKPKHKPVYEVPLKLTTIENGFIVEE